MSEFEEYMQKAIDAAPTREAARSLRAMLAAVQAEELQKPEAESGAVP